jgi:hypothetical protein
MFEFKNQDFVRVFALEASVVAVHKHLTVLPAACLLPACLPAHTGLVFVPLSQPYLHEYGDDWITSSPRRLVDKALNGLMDKPGQQIIVMSQVLVDDINTGYQQFQNLQVRVCGGGVAVGWQLSVCICGLRLPPLGAC